MLSAREIKPPPVLTTYPLNSIILAYSSICASKTKIFFVLKNSLCLSRGGALKLYLFYTLKGAQWYKLHLPSFARLINPILVTAPCIQLHDHTGQDLLTLMCIIQHMPQDWLRMENLLVLYTRTLQVAQWYKLRPEY